VGLSSLLSSSHITREIYTDRYLKIDLIHLIQPVNDESAIRTFQVRGIIRSKHIPHSHPYFPSFLNWYIAGWSPIGSPRQCGHQWPIVPVPGDYDDGEIGGMIGRGNRSSRRKPAPVPLCPLQTAHAARLRSRVASGES
jgi:hypothetical protein